MNTDDIFNTTHKSELLTKDRSIMLFKYFIEFLQIWGQENYGENVEIDWCKALAECQKFHLFDLNSELEEVIYSSEEEFKDLAFKWVENKVLNGWTIWRLFKLSPWLLSELEEEYSNDEVRQEYNNYLTHKCYRCKYYRDHASWFKNTINGMKNVSVDDELPENEEPLHWRPECAKRIDLMEGKPKFSRLGSRHNFEYEKFNTSSQDWVLEPEELHDCPYFEEGGMDWPTHVKHTFGIEI